MNTLTEKIARERLQQFFHEKPLVIFGTGISCAVDIRFGMNALQNELQCKVPPKLNGNGLKKEWQCVIGKLNQNVDLENAMNIVMDPKLIEIITSITGEFISSIDEEYATMIMGGSIEWPAAKLFRKLVENLPATDPTLHVITPNYDLLAEYAFEKEEISYINGFIGGICRYLDWTQCEKIVKVPGEKINRKRITKTKKHIRLHKVHGSINMFWLDDRVRENNAWIMRPPKGRERIIITPGISKYERITDFRKALLQKADEAIEKESSFLFIGYGFNDKHLEKDITLKLINQKCKGVIITKDANERIQNLVSQADNLWLVCKYMDEKSEGTCISNKQYSNVLYLRDKKTWDVATFTTEILGG
jgi:hypothetical protein